ncbi:MAG TPA: TolC family protein [Bryobacteraceae bacterium]|nr:TolC family protein [Bryobacteraceae bacterium]
MMFPIAGRRRSSRRNLGAALAMAMAGIASAQALTWEQVKEKFQAANPTLLAAQSSIDEARANEITAYLRPNPDLTLTADGTQLTPHLGVYRPFAGTDLSPSVSYLHERDHKRELRRDSARQSTEIAESGYQDQARTLLFTLRSAFVQTLQAKAVLENARQNLEYWDRELDINRQRFQAGDLAEVDLDRLELQRVQFESDYQNALVNLRTSKIQLLMLLNSRTPIENFDVTGAYEFAEQIPTLDGVRAIALEARPDLKSAVQNVELARLNHQLAVANGSTDPTFSLWWTHNASFNNPYDYNTIGGSVSIPLRVFDRNQGEKARTEIDIGRNEKLREAAEAQVFSDVDSAYVTLESTLNLLKPYRDKYLKLATTQRDKLSFSYQHGGASLLDYLDAEKSYRDTRLAYLNLIGSYLTAAAQLNLAAGREVIP